MEATTNTTTTKTLIDSVGNVRLTDDRIETRVVQVNVYRNSETTDSYHVHSYNDGNSYYVLEGHRTTRARSTGRSPKLTSAEEVTVLNAAFDAMYEFDNERAERIAAEWDAAR